MWKIALGVVLGLLLWHALPLIVGLIAVLVRIIFTLLHGGKI
jgi:hypothetical protein